MQNFKTNIAQLANWIFLGLPLGFLGFACFNSKPCAAMSSCDMPYSVVPNDWSTWCSTSHQLQNTFYVPGTTVQSLSNYLTAQKWFWRSGTMALPEWLAGVGGGGCPWVKDEQGSRKADASLCTTWARAGNKTGKTSYGQQPKNVAGELDVLGQRDDMKSSTLFPEKFQPAVFLSIYPRQMKTYVHKRLLGEHS